jgi:site-specific DNA-methyltransferase (adenine-specific)
MSTLPPAFWVCDQSIVYRGNALSILRALPDASVDAVVTDPPYSSGGLHRSARSNVATSEKYSVHGTDKTYPEFFGDNRDQRGFGYWASLWLAECFRITKPGGCLLMFTDWRQLPLMTDAVQAGGWTWRGIVSWDKTEAAKPQKGWFRHQCEYVLTASQGAMGNEQERAVKVCAPGVFRKAVSSSDKFHQTGKPVELMQSLLQVVPPGGVVLDPFAGSGSTLLAAKNLGYRSIGVELSAEYCAVIRLRLSQETLAISS